MGKKPKAEKIDRSGGESLSQNPFAGLAMEGLPSGPAPAPEEKKAVAPKSTGRGRRLEIRREKSGRGGKTVTVISGFAGQLPNQVADMGLRLRKRCGAGGTSRPDAIEVQGDHRGEAMKFFQEQGFRPVLAGG